MKQVLAPLFVLVGLALMAGAAVTGCRGPSSDNPPPGAAPPLSAPALGSTASVPHGDHNPRHGGVVLMRGDLHYEVVLDSTGKGYRLYFTDARREDLPASVASQVTLTIRRPGSPDETIPLQIDDAGESWTGSGNPVTKPAAATVRVAFTMNHELYWIDIPFAKPAPPT
jgi:hypothetical protein